MVPSAAPSVSVMANHSPLLDLSCWDDVAHFEWNSVDALDWSMLEQRYIAAVNAIADGDTDTADHNRDADYDYDGDSSTSDEEDSEAKATRSRATTTTHASAAATTTAGQFEGLELSELACDWLAHASENDRRRFQRKMVFIAEFSARAMAGHVSETNKGRTKKMKGSKKANLWRTKLDKGWVCSQNLSMLKNEVCTTLGDHEQDSLSVHSVLCTLIWLP